MNIELTNAMERRISYILMNFLAIGFIAFVISFPIMNINSNKNKSIEIVNNTTKVSKNEKFIKIPKQRSYNLTKKMGKQSNLSLPNFGKGKIRKFK
jgi:ABC-type uncharacterized transport system permease subunit